MGTYLRSISAGILVFPLVALALSVPYMVWEYRRHGSISIWKTVVVFSFVLYLICSFYLIILPLPKNRDAYVSYAATPQLVPFRALSDIIATTHLSLLHPRTWLAALKTSTVYTEIFNLMLLIPLGVYARYFRHARWWQAVLAGFFLSLFFEVTQLTGIYGIYAHPYRLFDVDDLIVNTSGALVGFWLAAPLIRVLPDIDEVNESSEARGAARTSFTRRVLAFAIDAAIAAAICAATLFAEHALFSSVRIEQSGEGLLGLVTAVTGVVFILIPMITRGQTLGQQLLRLRMVRPDATRAHWYNYLARYGLLVWVSFLLPLWLVVLYPGSVEGVSVSDLVLVVATYYVVYLTTLVVRGVRSAMGKPFVLLSGLVSNTRVMSLAQIEARHAQSAYADIDEPSELS